MIGSILRGAAAGAAGTTALNAATYLDMVLRGRPASSTPKQTVEKLTEKTGVEVPGDDKQRGNRVSGLGALMGMTTGVTVGACYGALRALGWTPGLPVAGLFTTASAIAGSAAPMTALGVTDPRTWSTTDWLSDVVPHLAYGLTTVATYRAMDSR
ncbi:hypothetical protein SAMN05421810_101243 [Amycolatopsis arida]|uniref:DUF1440 domain-containing protein n=1 Tax=Amycolatopsis arida TaxID=587909 RepID=A0A1I5KPD6_9PSEU|nr:hypothetical protein [Amycolatopsis arida]TDX97138.1 hypothetical protein CLV69_102241 [Amycolatopsis arida]SFO86757.1 hypothetical protein SAMN05421810_101243 [Amycolatopsis arida]